MVFGRSRNSCKPIAQTGTEPAASTAALMAGASLTRFWFSCSSWRKDCSSGPKGTLWSWEGAALGEAGLPVPGGRGGHGQGLGPELGAPPCLAGPCSLPECRCQPHASPASICTCLAPAGSLSLCRRISTSSLVIKLSGTSLPTLGPLPPVPGAGKALADSAE